MWGTKGNYNCHLLIVVCHFLSVVFGKSKWTNMLLKKEKQQATTTTAAANFGLPSAFLVLWENQMGQSAKQTKVQPLIGN
jgi:hypothetical protein